ncbi:MAG: AI-2E family transporter [Erysipelotrichaceae bacterium]|nr:AI-2E family transporter [Erysipelotrichaceae bacterium]
MDFKHLSPETKEKIFAFTISGVLVVIFYVMMNHLNVLTGVFGLFLKAISPFLYGLLFTFIMLPLRKLIEERLLKDRNLEAKTKRKIAVAISMIAFLLIMTGFFVLLIPQLLDSIKVFVDSIGGYVRTIQTMIASLDAYNPGLADYLEKLVSTAGTALSEWLTGAQGGMSRILSYSINFAKSVLNFFIGMIISVYLLYDDERFKKQIKMILFGYLNEKRASNILHLLRLTKDTFNRFIFGKFIDSLIIGVICYICILIMRMPYAPLIAVVIGLTNMIPVFGPFIGAIPCIFILLIISPLKAVEFAVFILILQQIDGNLIGPYILGDAVGLPTLWVMFAIIVGGAMLGVIGMFIGVPVFSVLFELTKERVQNNLISRKINVDEK